MAQTAGGTYYAASSELVSSWPATSLDLANQLESRFAAKAPTASPTFTGTVTMSSATVKGAALDLVASGTVTSGISLIVNNCFTTTYDNYRVIFSWNSASTSQDILRLRASGTDATTSYYASGIGSLIVSNTVEYFPRSNNATAITVSTSTSGQKMVSLDIYNPAKAENTLYAGTQVYSSGALASVFGGAHLTASAYDGFSLIAGTGNLTGTVRVYGYRNS